jgi:hypothetical protein
MPLLSQIFLIGNEIGEADEFEEILSNELNDKLKNIYHHVFDAMFQFLENESIISACKALTASKTF